MTKERLEFWASLFALVAVLVPVFRGIWRSLRRRLTPRGLFLLFLTLSSLVAMILWMFGHWLHWNSNYQVWVLMWYILGQAIFFISDNSPISRVNIGLFVLSVATATAMLGAELQQTSSKQSRKSESVAKPSATPSN